MDDVKTKDQMIFNDPFAQRLLKKKKKAVPVVTFTVAELLG